MAWELYDELIGGIPSGIGVTDYCIGEHWCYIDSECGMGVAHVFHGGSTIPTFRGCPLDLDLQSVAQLAKSWRFSEASLGVAAIHAWYANIDKLEVLGADVDRGERSAARDQNPFSFLERDFNGKNVAVVGHFPNVEHAAKTSNIVVLERNCTSPLDVPDPACEYILPEQDFVLITGSTLINKTMPRLLELSRDAFTVVTGPSAIPHEAMISSGADMIAGSVVVEPEFAKLSIKGGSKAQWRAGIKKFCWRPDLA